MGYIGVFCADGVNLLDDNINIVEKNVNFIGQL
jgi:hypothetical protein